jgi:FAD/FMN-containing dehydrogenase
VIFGHLGDGNLHYNVARGPGLSQDELLALQPRIYDMVHASVQAHDGSISAEHGIGQLKRDELPRYKSPIELALMKRIKRALDPHGLFNPGKVLQM